MREEIDRSLRATVSEALPSGHVMLSWVAVAGIRHVDGGGYVVTLCSDDAPPVWQIRGMLGEAEAGISRAQILTELGEMPDE